MKETTAFLLTDAMEEVISAGTGTTAKFSENTGITVVGKTGTTSATKDLWFAGYTPYYSAAIWMGYDDPQKMKYVRSYHKYIWGDVMDAIHTGLPDATFEPPSGITRANICTESGMLVSEGICDADPRGGTTRYEYFVKGTEPTEVCDVHKEVLICTESGLFATEYCPEETVERRIMIQRHEPLDPAVIDEDTLLSIRDYIYEIPFSMLGEYCDVHGPNSTQPEQEGIDTDGDGIIDTYVEPGEINPNPDEETPDDNSNGENGSDTNGNTETNE